MKDIFEKLSSSQPLAIVLILGLGIFVGLGVLGGVPISVPIQTVDNVSKIIFLSVGGILLTTGLIAIFWHPSQRERIDRNTYGLTMDTPPWMARIQSM